MLSVIFWYVNIYLLTGRLCQCERRCGSMLRNFSHEQHRYLVFFSFFSPRHVTQGCWSGKVTLGIHVDTNLTSYQSSTDRMKHSTVSYNSRGQGRAALRKYWASFSHGDRTFFFFICWQMTSIWTPSFMLPPRVKRGSEFCFRLGYISFSLSPRHKTSP